MIIAKNKPIEEILKSLEGETKVFILGCGECATVTQTGGEKEVAEMKAKLEEAGKEVVAIDMAAADCQELDVKRILRQHKEAADRGRGVSGHVVRSGHAVGPSSHRQARRSRQ